MANLVPSPAVWMQAFPGLALKGVVDGGFSRQLPGCGSESKEFNAEVHRTHLVVERCTLCALPNGRR